MAALPKINLKAEIPEALKAEVATTRFGKILSLTPVVMTVIATMLAGLSSSEMTRAQYDRSLAAQRQSKAGDQWNFFQGKRLRAVMLRGTLDLLGGSAELRSLDAAALRRAFAGTPFAAELDAASAPAALAALAGGALPPLPSALALDAGVKAVLLAIETGQPDAEVARLLSALDGATLDEALRLGQAQTLAFDELTKPINQAIERWEKALPRTPEAAALRRDFTAARLTYNAARYDAEARLNQAIAELFELQVRRSNLSAERHHRRSSRFFYGMLAAQMGVIVATLALAAARRNLLWAIAAGAGAVALAFTVYVLLYV